MFAEAEDAGFKPAGFLGNVLRWSSIKTQAWRGQLGRQTVEVRGQRLWVKLCACRGPLVRMNVFNPEQDRRRLRSGCCKALPKESNRTRVLMSQDRTRSGQPSANSSGWYMSRLESLLIVLLVPLCKPPRRACVPARGPHERLRGCARPEV